MTVILLVLYMIVKPAPTAVGVATDAGTLHIEQATWGKNCNQLYTAYKRRYDELAKTMTPQQMAKKTPPIIIEDNNVLDVVNGLCEHKKQCTIEANTTVLGNMFSDCSKELYVTWRCFSYDKLHSAKTDNGETLKIDCSSAS